MNAARVGALDDDGDRAALTADAPRPALRGVLHLVAALLAPAALFALLLVADSPRRYVGAAIFATSLILLYASSASYHLAPWRPLARRIMRRIDHSMIYVLIAGTYTPFCLVVLDNGWGIPMLAVVWSLAGAGVLLANFWPAAPRALAVGLYLGLGWLGLVAAAPLASTLHPAAVALLVGGGAAYSLGGLVYVTRRPDPLPRLFGFHEVFHLLVVAGSALHFATVAVFVIGG